MQRVDLEVILSDTASMCLSLDYR